MHLTAQQLATFKTNILANTATIPAGQPWSGGFVGTQIKNVPNNSDGNTAVAGWYNLTASPAFTLWKKLVSLESVGRALASTEVAGLTAVNLSRLQVMAQYAPAGFDPSRSDTRAAFDDVFSGAGGTLTRPALLALWKRLATNFEKLFATGTGTDAAPAISAFPDNTLVDAQDVNSALNLP